MSSDPDQEHSPAPADETGDAPGDSGAAEEAEAPSHEATPTSPEQRLAAVYRQWLTPGKPEGEIVTLVRTTAGSPDGLPYLRLLGVDSLVADDAWEVWSEAQLASDSTPLGRVLRPIVALVPFGGRWTAGRSFEGVCSLEPIDHASPVRALSAARERWELVASRRLADVLDDGAAELPEAGAASEATR